MTSSSISPPTTDIVIIGAGASGLSLLLALDELDYPYSVTVLERNKAPANDRIWSFWDKTLAIPPSDSSKHQYKKPSHYNSSASLVPAYIESIICHQWSNWSLSSGQRCYTMQGGEYRYCSLRSEDLSTLAHARIQQNPNFTIIYRCIVTSISCDESTLTIDTRDGPIHTHKIVDTRPPPIDKDHRGMLQCFYGEEITLTSPIFDPSSMKLMHQLQCTELGIEFVYILPFSAHHALVEFTCFSLNPVDPDVLQKRLHEIIHTIVKQHKYVVQRTESAVLPMYPINQNIDGSSAHKPNIIYAGIAGGAMRASTGFSFLNAQRWATQCARQLVEHNSFSRQPPINKIYTIMDIIMLRVLRDEPHEGVKVFEQMFNKVEPSRFVRFMTQQATALDFAVVIWAMPKKAFYKGRMSVIIF